MKTILLLEDEPDVTKVFTLILRTQGYVVLETLTANMALEV